MRFSLAHASHSNFEPSIYILTTDLAVVYWDLVPVPIPTTTPSCPSPISTTSTLRSMQVTLRPVSSFRKKMSISRRSTNYTQVDWSLIQRTNLSSSTILLTSNYLTRSQRSQSRVWRDFCLQAQALSRWNQSLMAPTNRFTTRSPELD